MKTSISLNETDPTILTLLARRSDIDPKKLVMAREAILKNSSGPAERALVKSNIFTDREILQTLCDELHRAPAWWAIEKRKAEPVIARVVATRPGTWTTRRP